MRCSAATRARGCSAPSASRTATGGTSAPSARGSSRAAARPDTGTAGGVQCRTAAGGGGYAALSRDGQPASPRGERRGPAARPRGQDAVVLRGRGPDPRDGGFGPGGGGPGFWRADACAGIRGQESCRRPERARLAGLALPWGGLSAGHRAQDESAGPDRQRGHPPAPVGHAGCRGLHGCRFGRARKTR